MDRKAMRRRYDELSQDQSLRGWEDGDHDENDPRNGEMELKQAECVILSYRLIPEHDPYWDHVTPEQQVERNHKINL